ncbi:MAG TPA: hypothetical protein VFQ53_04205 [Kofleriaceae bacterium]|nr:hypothetical protein [Kofleriaceae bacterium]
MTRAFAVVIPLVSLCGVAFAQPAPPPPPPAAPPAPPMTAPAMTPSDPAPAPAPLPPPAETPPPLTAPAHVRTFSVTASPLHLVLPVVELAVEVKPMPKVGVQVIGGAGRVTDRDTMISATATEIGGQLNYYVMRDFSGLHVGAEVLYLHLSDVDIDVTASGAGLAAGPFVGYKVLTGAGFTFVAQLGAEFGLIRAKSSSAMAEDKKVIPLLNLNLGWSF